MDAANFSKLDTSDRQSINGFRGWGCMSVGIFVVVFLVLMDDEEDPFELLLCFSFCRGGAKASKASSTGDGVTQSLSISVSGDISAGNSVKIGLVEEGGVFGGLLSE